MKNMKTMKTMFVVASLIVGGFMQTGFAQEPVKKKVTFSAGKTSAKITGSIKGYNSIDYLVTAKEGQTLTVSLVTKNGANYFNVLPPGSTAEAIYTSDVGGNNFSGTLSASGTYSIRVYLMRSAARRNETANFTLNISVTGGGTATASTSGDAKVAGTNFNATGQIRGHVLPAAYGSKSADFGVVRHGNGRADVHVNFVGGNTRILRYDQGIWSCSGHKARAVRNNKDEWEVIVDEKEVYIVPDAVIFGG